MEQATTIQNIPLWMVNVSPMNPRKTFDQASLEELADNIKRQGLLQPITVRPVDYRDELTDGEVVSIPSQYEIVCGERRYRAVAMNGSETIACIVRDMTDEEAFDAMITENLQRKDVDPIEEAFAFAQLYARGKGVEEIANRFGKSVKFIRERIKLDGLLPEVKQWVSKGLMHIGAAIHIAKLAEADQRKFMEQFEPGEDDDMEDLEPITKEDAVEFTDHLFKTIASADWNNGFLGPCGCTCERCEYNSANEGCLFNDLKVSQDEGCCTIRDKWNAKRMAWWKHIIDKKADHLFMQGEEMKPGKVVLAHSYGYYGNGEDYQELKQYCIGQGYMLVSADMFERWQNLKIDDEATRQKLDAGEAYMVLLIDSDYRGVRVDEKCFPVREQESQENGEAAKVAQLVRSYKSNIEASKGSVANAMRQAVREYDLNAIAWKPLTDVEWEILLSLLINTAPYNVKYDILGNTHAKETDYAKEHNTGEGRDDIIRKWMMGRLSDSGVNYSPVLQECQDRLIEVWGIDDVQVKAKAAASLRKRQEKIEKELTKLGYDTEGKKLAF